MSRCFICIPFSQYWYLYINSFMYISVFQKTYWTPSVKRGYQCPVYVDCWFESHTNISNVSKSWLIFELDGPENAIHFPLTVLRYFETELPTPLKPSISTSILDTESLRVFERNRVFVYNWEQSLGEVGIRILFSTSGNVWPDSHVSDKCFPPYL